MKEPPRSQRWEDRALARFLKEHEDEFAAERPCIVLHNPDEEAKLTKVLIEGLWPGVVQAVAQIRPGLAEARSRRECRSRSALAERVRGCSGRSLLRPPRALPNTRAIATLGNDEAT